MRKIGAPARECIIYETYYKNSHMRIVYLIKDLLRNKLSIKEQSIKSGELIENATFRLKGLEGVDGFLSGLVYFV